MFVINPQCMHEGYGSRSVCVSMYVTKLAVTYLGESKVYCLRALWSIYPVRTLRNLFCVHDYKFVNFRKIVEMLLSCTGNLGDKSTLHPDVARTSKIFCCINN